MTTKTKHCSLKFYNNFLVTEFHTLQSIEGELVSPYDKPGNLGFVVSDVAHVGVSKEAYQALQTLKPGRDGLGEIDMFDTTDGKHVLAVMGGACGLHNIATVETSRQWKLPALEAFQLIDNDVPEGAKEAIDNPSEEDDDE